MYAASFRLLASLSDLVGTNLEDESFFQLLSIINDVSSSEETLKLIRLLLNNNPVSPEMSSINIPDDIADIVTAHIHELGVPAHLKGYQYLRDAIILVLRDPEVIHKITRVLYPTVARKNQTSPSRVERAIRHTIEVAWCRGNVDTLNKVFSYTISCDKGKPTNSEFISLIADLIRLELQRNEET